MVKFTAQQKFIVRRFGRNSSPAQVRLEFLKAYQIQSGRIRSQYRGRDFSRINEHFEKDGSIVKTPIKRSKTKRTGENVDKINKMLDEKKPLSIRKLAPKLSLSPTTVWKILRYDSKPKFYRQSTVQPLAEAYMEQRKNFCWFATAIFFKMLVDS